MSNWYVGLQKARAAAESFVESGPLAEAAKGGFQSLVTASVGAIRVRDRGRARRMVLLPARGLRAPTASVAPTAARNFLTALNVGVRGAAGTGASGLMKVVDSVHEDGAKLVEMAPEDVTALRAVQPGLRVVPEVIYQPAVNVFFAEEKPAGAGGGGGRSVQFTVRSQGGGTPVRDVMVVAFTNFAARQGVQGVTGASGTVTLKVPLGVKKFERVYAFVESGYWNGLKKNVKVAAGITLSLTPIDLAFTDCVRHFYANAGGGDGTGVKVGVIDSGVALDHPDLVVAGGECTIPGEAPGSFGPLGGPHGSHVAGIIGARGTPPNGVRGVAPGASIFSYRVFKANEGASNFSIIKAIDRAVAAGCDVINMSLGGGPRDAATESAISDAYMAGTVCVVAAGNDDRSPVSQPGAYQLCVAVSASGRKGTFPAGAAATADAVAPFGKDKKDFLAAFSNVGPEIDVTGPGVGVISSVPGGAYADMSGTSMACPAVTGVAARLLSSPASAAVLGGARDEARSNAIVQMLLQSSKKLGFGTEFEGLGLPRA